MQSRNRDTCTPGTRQMSIHHATPDGVIKNTSWHSPDTEEAEHTPLGVAQSKPMPAPRLLQWGSVAVPGKPLAHRNPNDTLVVKIPSECPLPRRAQHARGTGHHARRYALRRCLTAASTWQQGLGPARFVARRRQKRLKEHNRLLATTRPLLAVRPSLPREFSRPHRQNTHSYAAWRRTTTPTSDHPASPLNACQPQITRRGWVRCARRQAASELNFKRRG